MKNVTAIYNNFPNRSFFFLFLFLRRIDTNLLLEKRKERYRKAIKGSYLGAYIKEEEVDDFIYLLSIITKLTSSRNEKKSSSSSKIENLVVYRLQTKNINLEPL